MPPLSARGSERRRHPRLEHNVPVKISSGDVDIVTETSNLSCSGAFCRIDKYIAPMTRLKLNLLLPLRKNNKIATKRIHCEGVVVRTESTKEDDSFLTAIFFSEISPRDAKIVSEFVESVIQEQKHG
ncbi:MAG: PilZ domain-containing protein [Candidatus Omnitrophica bacterium]|nr:PilZ domain-containing protein [Candidatus Omnitrophota bacterium]